MIYTDNQALKWLKGLNSPNGRLTRWSILLSQFDFEVKHRSGKSHQNADALSRPVLMTLDVNELADVSMKLSDPYEDEPLLHYLKYKRDIAGISKKQATRVERAATLYKLKEDGSIMARKNSTLEFNLSVPKPEFREAIVLKEHELSHAKAAKIHNSLSSQNLYWRNMAKFIETVISKC